MPKYYKLSDAIANSVTLYLPHTKNGNRVYQYYTLHPGTLYEENVEDPYFVAALKDAHKRVPYNTQLEEALRRNGTRYEVVNCKVCGGRAKKLDVWFVEVVE